LGLENNSTSKFGQGLQVNKIKSEFIGGKGRFVSGLIIGMFIAGGVAVAAIPSTTTGKITACYATSGANKGALRVIDTDANEKCKSGEKQIAWTSNGLRFRGAWSSSASYVIDDVVVHNGSSYIALAATKNVQPPSAGKWTLMAAAGQDGEDGVDGVDGVNGEDGVDGVDGVDAAMVVADQSCEAPYRVIGYNSQGTIMCDKPVDTDGDTYVVDLWNTDPSLVSEDCNDSNDSIYPGASEVPNDSIDQDCDGNDVVIVCDDGDPYTYDYLTGSLCFTFPQDADVDTDGSFAYTAIGGYPDCDDTDPNINPSAYDFPWDGIDQNCDGTDNQLDCDDRDPYTYDYFSYDQCQYIAQDADVDSDGSSADRPYGGYPDCDDTDPNINPWAYDAPWDGIDQNCDGMDAMPE